MSNPIEHFALAAKQCSSAEHDAPLWLVMGNEAGDLDSIVSALCMAFVLHRASGISTLPYVQFPRIDFQLRPDAVLLFQSAGFELDESMVGARVCVSYSVSLPAQSVTLCDCL